MRESNFIKKCDRAAEYSLTQTSGGACKTLGEVFGNKVFWGEHLPTDGVKRGEYGWDNRLRDLYYNLFKPFTSSIFWWADNSKESQEERLYTILLFKEYCLTTEIYKEW